MDASCSGAPELEEALREEVSTCDCSLLSGGVNTSLIVAMHPSPGSLRAITVDLGGSDASYAMLVASRLGISHIIVRPAIPEFVGAVDWVLENMVTIDPIEVSANAVHYLSLSKAKEIGCSCVLTGDGADELFVGYSFLYGKPSDYIKSWIAERAQDSRLPTAEVGAMLGVTVRAPFFSERLKRVALSLPLRCLTDGKRGKIALREALWRRGLAEIAERPKEAVTTGSGALMLLESLAEAEEVESEPFDFRPPTRLHAWLLRRLTSLREPPPRTDRDPCPICGRRLSRSFCRFCGAYVDNRISLHYSGERT